jgi:hypothetical protein
VTAQQLQRPDKPLTPREAWQPFTPRGVAAFANATLTRVVLAQLAVALLVAAAVIWFLRVAWFPVITEAVEHLPETGMIQKGELKFSADSPVTLAANTRLAMVVDVMRAQSAGHAADIQVTFEKHRVAVCGALGCWWKSYDPNYAISFNRREVEPLWGAWRGPILAMVAVCSLPALYMMWWSLALVYVPIIKIIAFFTDRAVTWRGAWRLSAAALLPGALIVALGLVLYGFGGVDAFRLMLLYLLHIVCGLAFIGTSPFFLPKFSAARAGNPFNAQNSQ